MRSRLFLLIAISCLLLTSCLDLSNQPVLVLLLEKQTKQTREIYQVSPDGSQIKLIVGFSLEDSYWLSPQGNNLAILTPQTTNLPGPRAGTLSLYNTKTGEKIGTIEEVGQTVSEHFSRDENVVWSPNEDKLLFLRSSQSGKGINIFLYDLHTRESTRLTNNDGINLAPAWSPRADRVAFVQHKACELNVWDCPPEKQFWEIVATNLDGTVQYPITDFHSNDLLPPGNLWFTLLCNLTWSPDSKYIAFENVCGELLGIQYFKEVFITNVEGSFLEQLTQFTYYDVEATTFPETALAYTIHWSPSNDKIYIGYSQIEVIPDGKVYGGIDTWTIFNNALVVTDRQRSRDMLGNTSQWSPDGQFVLWFTMAIDNDQNTLPGPTILGKIVNGQAPILEISNELPYGSCYHREIHWSPDGHYVAYTAGNQIGTCAGEQEGNNIVVVSLSQKDEIVVTKILEGDVKPIGWFLEQANR